MISGKVFKNWHLPDLKKSVIVDYYMFSLWVAYFFLFFYLEINGSEALHISIWWNW